MKDMKTLQKLFVENNYLLILHEVTYKDLSKVFLFSDKNSSIGLAPGVLTSHCNDVIGLKDKEFFMQRRPPTHCVKRHPLTKHEQIKFETQNISRQ